jgi:glycosyltransferase involved in cell wall biosynthesis
MWPAQIDGDVLVAVKPRHDSLTLALKAVHGSSRPVISDVDDWEMAFFYDYPARLAKQLLALTSPRNFYRTLAAERRVRQAHAVTVSSTWLQSRFGGDIIPHVRDASIFDPTMYSRAEARQRIGVGDEDVVAMFIGTVMRHKGVDSIINAMARTERTDLVLASPADLRPAEGGIPRLRKLPPVTIAELPRVLVGADFVVFPQRRSRSSLAQVPAKIFDALAMGLPIITSDVSDLKTIVGEAGVALDSDDMALLSATIADFAANSTKRVRMGASGRNRFLESYSEDAVRPRWLEVIAQAERASQSSNIG